MTLPPVHTSAVINFLRPERYQHRQRFGGQRPQGVNLSQAKGQHSVQSILLLIFQHGELSEVLAGGGEQGFGVTFKLFAAVSNVNQRNTANWSGNYFTAIL